MSEFKKKRRLLFRIASCPYCQRAEQALDQAGITYDKIDVSSADRAIVQKLSGQRTVPIMVEVIGAESQDDDILEYIQHLKSQAS